MQNLLSSCKSIIFSRIHVESDLRGHIGGYKTKAVSSEGCAAAAARGWEAAKMPSEGWVWATATASGHIEALHFEEAAQASSEGSLGCVPSCSLLSAIPSLRILAYSTPRTEIGY
jgi:hypothetical protein